MAFIGGGQPGPLLHGINSEGSILRRGHQSVAVDKNGAGLQFAGELIRQGKEAVQKVPADNPVRAHKIIDAIMTSRPPAPGGLRGF